MTEPLNAALMQGSAVVHREAERVPFMVAFFKGELPQEAYAAYLARLWHVYVALESAASTLRDDPVIGWTYTPELFRADALRADHERYTGAPPDARSLTPATSAYADRIQRVARDEPHRFAAHHWLRYLGYLLGQDLLNKLVTKAYGSAAARSFYAFPEVQDARAYLAGYHQKMNGMPLDEDQRAAVVDEGVRAFERQIALTEELARDFGIADPDVADADGAVEDVRSQHP